MFFIIDAAMPAAAYFRLFSSIAFHAAHAAMPPLIFSDAAAFSSLPLIRGYMIRLLMFTPSFATPPFLLFCLCFTPLLRSARACRQRVTRVCRHFSPCFRPC